MINRENDKAVAKYDRVILPHICMAEMNKKVRALSRPNTHASLSSAAPFANGEHTHIDF
jgi:hypothetical protein